MQIRGLDVRHVTPRRCQRTDGSAGDREAESPLIPMYDGVEGFTRSGAEVFADGVSNWNHRRLHDVIVWDAEQVSRLALVREVQCCPAGA